MNTRNKLALKMWDFGYRTWRIKQDYSLSEDDLATLLVNTGRSKSYRHAEFMMERRKTFRDRER